LEIIQQYFDDFSTEQTAQFEQLEALYQHWNAQINVISRKDVDSLYLKHVLHSLSIATTFSFTAEDRILDIGTGGGFPGIPLAIFFPETQFVLADSIRKKLLVVTEIAAALKLKNVQTHWGRVEDIPQKNSFHFAVSRAVAPLGDLWRWSKPLIKKGHNGEHEHGLICLKGGDLNQEISDSGCKPMMWNIHDFFPEDAFLEKFMLYVKR
jgi:16S rRNA (guanine527-N7)-methyltransferase